MRGETEVFDSRLEEWLSKLDNEAKTISMKRSDILRFKERFMYTHLVDRGGVRKWAHELQHKNGLSTAAIRRIILACSGYWKYLQLCDVVSEDSEPFRDLISGSKRKSKSEVSKVWRPFAVSDLKLFLREVETRGTCSCGT